MKKPLSIQLSIPSPCSESWGTMTPDAQGRFCMHCQKSVIDFTTWSDTMLYEFFTKTKEPVCGHFHHSQLNRAIHIPPQPHSKLYRIAIALGLTILVAQAYGAHARIMPPLIEQNILIPVNNTTGSDTFVIKGQVLDEKKEPMIGAIVQLENHGIVINGTPTDIDGYFSMKISPDDYQQLPDSLLIRISYCGYRVQIVHINKNQPEVAAAIEMQVKDKKDLCDIIILGGTNYWPLLINPQQSGPNKTFNGSDLRHMGY